MNITIKNVPEFISKKELREAANFYIAKLMSKRIAEKLSIIIDFKKIDCKGHCEWVDKPVRPKSFKITLNNLYKKRTTLITLAHELVHVKQYATGELSDETSRNHAKWKKEIIDEVKTDYWELPFEIEAYGREPGLYINFHFHQKFKERENKLKLRAAQAKKKAQAAKALKSENAAYGRPRKS